MDKQFFNCNFFLRPFFGICHMWSHESEDTPHFIYFVLFMPFSSIIKKLGWSWSQSLIGSGGYKGVAMVSFLFLLFQLKPPLKISRSATDWGKESQSLITLTEKKDDLVKQFVCGLNNFMWCLLELG